MVRLNAVAVLDTSAIPLATTAKGRAFTTPRNVEEAKRGPHANLVATLLEAGKLVIREPTCVSMEIVKKAALMTGDASKLSEADLNVIALALDLSTEGHDVVLISDDYAVQNVAARIGVKVASATTRGIKEQINWLLYCPVCGATYEGYASVCPECNVALKRKRREPKRDGLRGPPDM